MAVRANRAHQSLREDLVARGVVIKTDDLWKTYEMGTEHLHALRGISLEIHKGEFVAIMGPSGSGKSTLMNLIGCLDTPSRGSYWLAGRLASQLDDDEARRAIRNKGDRVRLSDVQPAAARNRAAQCRAAADLQRQAFR